MELQEKLVRNMKRTTFDMAGIPRPERINIQLELE